MKTVRPRRVVTFERVILFVLVCAFCVLSAPMADQAPQMTFNFAEGGSIYAPQDFENSSGYDWLVFVSIPELKLVLRNWSGQDVRTYRIAGPRKDEKFLPNKPRLVGEVKRVIIDPWWYPTGDTRDDYLETKGVVLPEKIGPNDPLNAMGKAKIIIQFAGYSEPIRIHGTNQPHTIGRRASRGCIRMLNRDILELSEILAGRKSQVVLYYYAA
jgi:lipoprotein-anchoring transpeptidase ErfK/SrfK